MWQEVFLSQKDRNLMNLYEMSYDENEKRSTESEIVIAMQLKMQLRNFPRGLPIPDILRVIQNEERSNGCRVLYGTAKARAAGEADRLHV